VKKLPPLSDKTLLDSSPFSFTAFSPSLIGKREKGTREKGERGSMVRITSRPKRGKNEERMREREKEREEEVKYERRIVKAIEREESLKKKREQLVERERSLSLQLKEMRMKLYTEEVKKIQRERESSLFL
jgi:hypothetical protein